MKSERIKELEAIANNQSMEVHDRLQEIEKKLKTPISEELSWPINKWIHLVSLT